MIVRVLPDAEADIEVIGDFIAQDNPRRAMSFVEELRVVCNGLGFAPSAFRWCPAMSARVSVIGSMAAIRSFTASPALRRASMSSVSCTAQGTTPPSYSTRATEH